MDNHRCRTNIWSHQSKIPVHKNMHQKSEQDRRPNKTKTLGFLSPTIFFLSVNDDRDGKFYLKACSWELLHAR